MMPAKANRITATQFMFSIATYVLSNSLLSLLLFPVTHQDSWLVALIGVVCAIPLIYLFVRLMRDFPGKNLFDIHRIAYGKWIGGVLNALYSAFFLTLTAVNLRFLSDFIQQTTLVSTPSLVVIASLLLLCCYSVWHGLNATTRLNAAFTFIISAVLVLSILFVMNQLDWENLLPMLDQKPQEYAQGLHITVSLLIGEVVIFLMIAPNVVKQKKRIAYYWFIGFAIGAASIVLAVLRDLCVLGNTVSLFALPFYETLRLVALSPSLSRMEILFIIILIHLFFCKIMMLFFISVRSIALVTRQRSYKYLALPIGAFLLYYALSAFPSSLNHLTNARSVSPWIWTPFCIVLPLLSYCVARIRTRRAERVEA